MQKQGQPAREQPALLTACACFRWFCHVDDDNYVILPSLQRLLSSYHHSQDIYLGRPSLDHPIEAAERVKSDGSVSQLSAHGEFLAPLRQILQQGILCHKELFLLITDSWALCFLFQVSVKFWFATGGAGFCISRGLALKMSPWARWDADSPGL